MTVHRAKGLEFPVVILADIGANIAAQTPSRYVDPERGLCAVRLAGWSPWDLLDHEEDELARDAPRACASPTWPRRARATCSWSRRWATIRSRADGRRRATAGSSRSSAPSIRRPSGGGRPRPRRLSGLRGGQRAGRDRIATRRAATTCSPGLHVLRRDGRRRYPRRVVGSAGARPRRAAALRHPPPGPDRGRRAPSVLEADRRELSGLAARAGGGARAGRAAHAFAVRTVDRVGAARRPRSRTRRSPEVERVVDAASRGPATRRARASARSCTPSWPRCALDAGRDAIAEMAEPPGAHPRRAGRRGRRRRRPSSRPRSPHPLMARAREAWRARPVPSRDADHRGREPDGAILEGVLDLAFEEDDGWTVVDFKTQAEMPARSPGTGARCGSTRRSWRGRPARTWRPCSCGCSL